MDVGQVLHTSPYVTQIEKLADSMKQLTNTFLRMEEKKKAFTEDEVERMFDCVKEKVCGQCEKCSWCWGENFVRTYQMGYEILSAVDRYGNELNTETKRRLQQCCVKAPRFLREILEAFHEARQNMMWVNRIAQSREGCALQMDTFADLIRISAKELEDSMFTDERLSKKITANLKRRGVRVLNTNFFMNKEGKYEVHVTARSLKEQYVTVKEVAKEVSAAMGRRLVPEGTQSQMLGKEYATVICLEGPRYYTLHGEDRER